MSLILVFGTIALVTIIELFVCHFTLWWVIALAARLMFSLRLVGATIKIKTLAIMEAIALGSMLVWNMIFAKDSLPWFRIIMFALFGLICVGIMFIDDMTEIYTSVDEEDY